MNKYVLDAKRRYEKHRNQIVREEITMVHAVRETCGKGEQDSSMLSAGVSTATTRDISVVGVRD